MKWVSYTIARKHWMGSVKSRNQWRSQWKNLVQQLICTCVDIFRNSIFGSMAVSGRGNYKILRTCTLVRQLLDFGKSVLVEPLGFRPQRNCKEYLAHILVLFQSRFLFCYKRFTKVIKKQWLGLHWKHKGGGNILPKIHFKGPIIVKIAKKLTRTCTNSCSPVLKFSLFKVYN